MQTTTGTNVGRGNLITNTPLSITNEGYPKAGNYFFSFGIQPL